MFSKTHLIFLVLIAFVAACYGNFYEFEDQNDRFRIPSTYNNPQLYSRNQPNYYDRRPNLYRRGSYSNEVVARAPVSREKIVNVDDFGATSDGQDNSQAFMKAWNEACSSGGSVTLVVPRKVYVLKPVTFSGPCPSNLIFKIYGTLKATNDPSDYSEDSLHWLHFKNVQNFRMDGGGVINGNGQTWWQNSCKVNKDKPCKHAPTAVTFSESSNLAVSNIWFQDAQQMHLIFEKCNNVRALNLQVTAPGNSPNTDGIHVTETQNIRIMNSVIRTGDDCISIVSGSKNVRAIGITCGPGHGISIGSLGEGNSEAYVSDVLVDKVRLSGTTNGVRIKTWQGGSGYAKNIIFQNVMMHNVTNPVLIDQNYCDQDKPCATQHSAVKISNVIYRNIRGTSASEEAINLQCSKSFPCQGIWLQDITLGRQELNQEDDQVTKASCSNVGITTTGDVSPRCSSN